MKLEGLIRKRLLESRDLSDKLVRYDGSPAIFFGDAPDDDQKEWSSKEAMPRISFNYDTLADKERKSAGSLYVSIYCRNEAKGGAAFPEDIVPLVIRLLKDVVFDPDDFSVFYCTWNRTEPFSVKDTKNTDAAYSNNSVIGCVRHPGVPSAVRHGPRSGHGIEQLYRGGSPGGSGAPSP